VFSMLLLRMLLFALSGLWIRLMLLLLRLL